MKWHLARSVCFLATHNPTSPNGYLLKLYIITAHSHCKSHPIMYGHIHMLLSTVHTMLHTECIAQPSLCPTLFHYCPAATLHIAQTAAPAATAPPNLPVSPMHCPTWPPPFSFAAHYLCKYTPCRCYPSEETRYMFKILLKTQPTLEQWPVYIRVGT